MAARYPYQSDNFGARSGWRRLRIPFAHSGQDQSGLASRTMWGRVFVGFVCLWLLFGAFLQLGAANYTNMLARTAALDSAIATSQKAQTSPQNSVASTKSPAANLSSQKMVSASEYGPVNIPQSDQSVSATLTKTTFFNPDGQLNLSAFHKRLLAPLTKNQPDLASSSKNGKACQQGSAGTATPLLASLAPDSNQLSLRANSLSTGPCNLPFQPHPGAAIYYYSDLDFQDLIAADPTTPPTSYLSDIQYGQVNITSTGTVDFELTGTLNGNNLSYLAFYIDDQLVLGGLCEGIAFQKVSFGFTSTGWHNFVILRKEGGSECWTEATHFSNDLVWSHSSIDPFDPGWEHFPPSDARSNVPLEHTFGQCDISSYAVDPVTGNFCNSIIDMGLASPVGGDLALKIGRTYNSLDGEAGFFGAGWHSTFDMKLISNTNAITVTNPNGRRDTYDPPLTGNKLVTPSLANSDLFLGANSLGNPVYTLTTASLITYTFDSSGKLGTVVDRNNTQLTLNYSSGNLSSVSDNYGRQLNFSFNNGRVTSISDNTGRSVSYHYDPTYTYLTEVVDADNHANPIKYSYGSDCNLLTDITDQNNNVVVHNVYNSATSQIITQTFSPVPGVTREANYSYNQLNLVRVPFISGTVLTKTDLLRVPTTVFTNTRGFTTTYSYKANNLKVNELSDSYAKSTDLTRDSNDMLSGLKNASDNNTTATYTDKGRPEQITSTATVNGTPTTISVTSSYNQRNDPTQIKDANGNPININYDGSGNPTSVTNPLLHDTTVDYDPTVNGRITKVTSLNGLVTTYHYNLPGTDPNRGLPSSMIQTYDTLVNNGTSLVSKSYQTDYQYTPQGWLSYRSDPYDTSNVPNPIPATRFEYDDLGHLITTTNQLSQKLINSYDPVGNIISTTNFLGQQTLYEYDHLRRLTKITQVLATGNLVTTNSYDEADNLISQTVQRTPTESVTFYKAYDKLNRLTSVTTTLQTGGLVETDYEYDEVGNLTKTIQRNTGTGFSGDQTTTYEYDASNRLVKTILPDGIDITYKYDANGNVLEDNQQIAAADRRIIINTYDAINRIKTSTINGTSLLTTYNYDDPSNLRDVTDPYGVKTTIKSDATGRPLITTINPSTTQGNPGALSQVSYNYYDARGLVIRAIDPALNQTDYGYDQLRRLTSTTHYTGTVGTFSTLGTALTTNITYLDQPQPQVTIVGPAPQNERQDNYYDEAGRLTSTKIYTGAIATTALNTTYTYDGQGNRTSVTYPNNFTTYFSYENTGWLTSVAQTVTVPSANPPVQTLTTNFAYDLLGNMISSTNAAGHTSKISYDVMNRVQDKYDALPLTPDHWHYTYDGLGRLVEFLDAKTQSSTYTYDKASRLLTVSSDNNQLTTDFTYGNGPNPLTMVDRIGANSTTTSHVYDGLRRLISVTNPIGAGVITYTYDVAGRRSGLYFGPDTSPANVKSVTYGYDGLSRPVSMTNWANQTATYIYSGTHLSQLTYPNGITATYRYDGVGQLTDITQVKDASSIFTASYTLDKLGNRTKVAEKLNGISRVSTYSYDELSRLLQETQQVGGISASSPTHIITSTYSYDEVGNRKQMVSTLPSIAPGGIGSTSLVLTTDYTYNEVDQLKTRTQSGSLTTLNLTDSYNYDPNGSLTSETNAAAGETIAYTYDARNRLTQWQKQAKNTTQSTATFRYDGSDMRLSLTYQGQTTTYLQDYASPLPVVLQEKQGSQPVSSFMYELNGSTTPLFQTDPTGAAIWYHTDGLGSVRALTDNNGATLETASYSAFGLKIGETGKTSSNFGFAGEQLDPTGLYFNRARYYNPSLGRFISRDPLSGSLGNPSSLNRYVYATNNPALLTDPTGMTPGATLFQFGPTFPPDKDKDKNKNCITSSVLNCPNPSLMPGGLLIVGRWNPFTPQVVGIDASQTETQDPQADTTNAGSGGDNSDDTLKKVLKALLAAAEAVATTVAIGAVINYAANDINKGIDAITQDARNSKKGVINSPNPDGIPLPPDIPPGYRNVYYDNDGNIVVEYSPTSRAIINGGIVTWQSRDYVGNSLTDLTAWENYTSARGPLVGRQPGEYNSKDAIGLYVWIDSDGVVRYIGQGDIDQRDYDHTRPKGKNQELFNTWTRKTIANNTLTEAEANGLEGLLIEHYRFGGGVGDPLYNERRVFGGREEARPLYAEALKLIEDARKSVRNP